MKWKLYYSDGATFGSAEGSWQDAPIWGVQFLLTEDRQHGRYVDFGHDFYVWWPGSEKPWGVDLIGLLDYLRATNDEQAHLRLCEIDFDELWGVKYGRLIGRAEFEAMHTLANNDPDFPARTAYQPEEVRA